MLYQINIGSLSLSVCLSVCLFSLSFSLLVFSFFKQHSLARRFNHTFSDSCNFNTKPTLKLARTTPQLPRSRAPRAGCSRSQAVSAVAAREALGSGNAEMELMSPTPGSRASRLARTKVGFTINPIDTYLQRPTLT